MKNHIRSLLVAALLAGSASQVLADGISADAVLGGALGGGAGAAVGSALGGRNGAMLGGALGAATGVAIATPRMEREVRVVSYRDDDDWHEHHDRGLHLGHYRHHHDHD